MSAGFITAPLDFLFVQKVIRVFDRILSLIGEENFKIIQEKNILVLGLGGVGGYVVEGLVRSGIKNITVVDKDIVDVTNLNRQIIALNSTIGFKKTETIKKRILDINSKIAKW